MAHLFDQPASNETVTWRADSDFRGSYSILSTCTITLFLGVWSAVHLNLPGNPKEWQETFVRRLAWIFSSLFAPEAMILIAWTQRKAAKRVQIQVEKIFVTRGQNTTDTEAQKPTLEHKWTMTHSFWAIMGGIAGDGIGSEPFIPTNVPPKLTEKGIYFLLQTAPELLPDVAEGEVKDKSKGDWLTKSLACIQASWFCVACLIRIGQSLPLSLLELNTFAHAMCTIVVYFVWWHKPLDVERPLLIKSPKMRPLLAYMWMASAVSARETIKKSGDTTYKVSSAPEFEALKLGKFNREVPSESHAMTGTETSTITMVTPNSGLAGTKFFVNQSSARWKVEEHYCSPDEYGPPSTTVIREDPAVFTLDASDVRRWKLAHEAMKTYKLSKPTQDLDLVTIKPVPETFDSPKHSAGISSEDKFERPWAIVGFCMLAAAYGALHALAWNTRFPSRRQRILWQVSSLIIASPAGAALIIVILVISTSYIARLIRRIRSSSRQEKKNEVGDKGTKLFGVYICDTIVWESFGFLGTGIGILSEWIFVSYVMVLYFPARVYIVGESFRMAFYLPPGAFRATQWEQFFPHFG